MNISVKNKVSIVIISAFALLMTQSFVSGSKDDDHEKILSKYGSYFLLFTNHYSGVIETDSYSYV